MKNIKYFIVAGSLLIVNFKLTVFNSFAQDIHFSQFYSSPLYLNPATTGVFDKNYRVSTNYRTQWTSIASPYKTFSAASDMSFLKGKNKNGLGIGAYFFSDKAGSSEMGKTLAGLSYAYNIMLNQENFLSCGIMTAYAQRSISADKLKWGNQFDGVNYNQYIASGEQNLNNNFTYYDIGGGILWNYNTSGNLNIKGNAGFAFFHINKPNNSYFIDAYNPLSPKYVIHGEIQNKLKNTNITVMPRFFAALQNPYKEIIAGVLIKHELGMTSKYTGLLTSSAIYFGGLYRWNDSFILNFAVDYKNNLSIGLSYDINISSLSLATYGRGGFEISLIHKGFFTNNSTVKTTPKGNNK